MSKLLILFLSIFLFSFSLIQAQILENFCDYNFTRPLQVGIQGEDVKILQKILNLDEKTIISTSGLGSKESETDFFGSKTKIAVEKFQKIYSKDGEVTGIANLPMLNYAKQICLQTNLSKNDNPTEPNIYLDNNLNTNTPPKETKNRQTNVIVEQSVIANMNAPANFRVSLSANFATILPNQNFKVILNSSVDISEIFQDKIITDGATINGIRKLSRNSYSILLTSNSDAKNITIQLETEAVRDINGNLNAVASNEITLTVLKEIAATENLASPTPTQNINNSYTSLFDQILQKITNTFTINSNPINPYLNTSQAANNNNSGNSSGSAGGGSSGLGGSSGGGFDISKILSGLMGGGNGSGGASGAGGSPQGGGIFSGQTQSGPAGLLNTIMNSVKNGGQTSGGQVSGECGGNFSQAEAEAKLKEPAIGGSTSSSGNCSNINNPRCTSLEQLPKKMILFLAQIRKDCPSCQIVITGGTEVGHQTHGPGLPVIDMKKGGALDSLFSSGNYHGARVEVHGGNHWHIYGQGYGCKTSAGATSETKEEKPRGE